MPFAKAYFYSQWVKEENFDLFNQIKHLFMKSIYGRQATNLLIHKMNNYYNHLVGRLPWRNS